MIMMALIESKPNISGVYVRVSQSVLAVHAATRKSIVVHVDYYAIFNRSK
jgi:hypothetical protein